jgi:hypothetical protein
MLDPIDGVLEVPPGPGLGGDPDPGVMEKYRVVQLQSSTSPVS